MGSRPVVSIGRSEALAIAFEARMVLEAAGHQVKAVHVMPKLHGGHLTIRVFMVPQTAEDPEPFIFTREEL